MTVVILCGGAGTRLWPLSRPERPKQFAGLFEGPTLFEATVSRNLPLADRFIVVTNAAHRDLAIGQFRKAAGAGVGASFLLEPEGRNTAAAIALAALRAGPGEILLVVPSDHAVTDTAAYRTAAGLAAKEARSGSLVTFGIQATGPETGYGYIEAGEEGGSAGVFKVTSFREKPSREVAEGFLRSAGFSWNSGMFVFSREAILEEFAVRAATILETARTALDGAGREDQSAEDVLSIAPVRMKAIPATSIDYAVMEGCSRLQVIPVAMGWSDLGSFDALYDVREKDGNGNSAGGEAIFFRASGNLAIGEGFRIAFAGVEDLVVIQDGHDILITRRGRTQLVGELSKLAAGQPKPSPEGRQDGAP